MKQLRWDILEGKLEGSLSAEDEILFKAWYEESAEHREYFRRIESFYRRDGYVKEVDEGQAEASWRRFWASRMRERFRRRLFRFAAVGCAAACVAAGVFLVPGLWREEAPKAGLLPAKPESVMLTLSTGERVELNDRKGEITDKYNKIENTGSSLNYTPKNALAAEERSLRNRVETPLGGEYQVALEDGTVVYLGASSSLDYPVAFTGDRRVVRVEGEAYFEVSHDAERPFIVETDDMQVKVLGTKFNVRNYADEDFMETTLVDGSVRVFAGSDSCLLEPNQQAVVDRSSEQMYSREVNVSEFVAWKDGKLNVRNQRLEDILDRLGKWYDIEVFYMDEGAKDARFYADIDRYGDLEELLDKFAKTGTVYFDVRGNVIRVGSVAR